MSAEVLRSVPLRQIEEQAKKVVMSPDWLMDWILAEDIPDRMRTPRDYAALAKVYVQLADRGVDAPIVIIARALGVSANTVNTRLRKARGDRLVEGLATNPANPARLTAKATALLATTTAQPQQDEGPGE